MPKLSFYFRQMVVLIRLIAFCPSCGGSFSGTPQTLKSFKLHLLAPWFRVWIARGCWNRNAPFLGKRIINLSPVAPIKLASLSTSRPIASRSRLQIFPATCCTTPILHSMVEGPSRDPTIANPPVDEDTRSDSGTRTTLKSGFRFRTKPPLGVRASDASILPMVGYLLELLCDRSPFGGTMQIRQPSSTVSPQAPASILG
jgi:hypothetical protein